MGKAKKKWKKQAPDANLNLQLDRERQRKEEAVKDMNDNELFMLDFDKAATKKARMTLKQKLRIKKLKEQNEKTSKTQKLLRERAKKQLLSQSQRKEQKKNLDLWDQSSVEPKIYKKKKQFIEFTKNKEIPLPSVLKPMPGQSYNPSGKDYQDLTKKVVHMKLNELQKIDQIKRKIYPDSFKSQIEQLKCGDDDDNDDDEGSSQEQNEVEVEVEKEEVHDDQELSQCSQVSSDTYSDYFSQDQQQQIDQPRTKKKNIAKVTLRKTKKQKLKKRLNKMKQEQEKQDRIRAKLLKQIPGIPSIMGQLQKQKRQNEQRKRDKTKMIKQLKQLQLKGQIIKPKRLGKHIYKQQIPSFKLLEQIPGNLRQSTVAQSLIKDRFDSLMRLGKTQFRWDPETGKRSQFGRKKLSKKLVKKQYERTTGFSDRKEYHQASSKDTKEKKEKGMFY